MKDDADTKYSCGSGSGKIEFVRDALHPEVLSISSIRLFGSFIALSSLFAFLFFLPMPDALATSYYGNGDTANDLNRKVTTNSDAAAFETSDAKCAKYQLANKTPACSADAEENAIAERRSVPF